MGIPIPKRTYVSGHRTARAYRIGYMAGFEIGQALGATWVWDEFYFKEMAKHVERMKEVVDGAVPASGGSSGEDAQRLRPDGRAGDR